MRLGVNISNYTRILNFLSLPIYSFKRDSYFITSWSYNTCIISTRSTSHLCHLGRSNPLTVRRLRFFAKIWNRIEYSLNLFSFKVSKSCSIKTQFYYLEITSKKNKGPLPTNLFNRPPSLSLYL